MIDKLKNRFVTGAWLTDVKHYFSKINEIIDYLNGNGSSNDGSYKVYIATLTQSSTNAPIANVLQNTLGGTLVWTIVGNGTYLATLNNVFGDGTKVWFNPIAPPAPYYAYMQYNDPNSIQLNTTDPAFSNLNGVLYLPTSIEIRVYN